MQHRILIVVSIHKLSWFNLKLKIVKTTTQRLKTKTKTEANVNFACNLEASDVHS